MEDFPKKIRMTQSKLGAHDGNTVKMYEKDTVHENLGGLAKTFVNAGWAEVIDEPETTSVKSLDKSAPRLIRRKSK